MYSQVRMYCGNFFLQFRLKSEWSVKSALYIVWAGASIHYTVRKDCLIYVQFMFNYEEKFVSFTRHVHGR